jgi:cobaltochelatase CobN
MSVVRLPLVATRRPALAQVAFCLGCCCGRTDRGRPALPLELLKAAWKKDRLNDTVQLTVSGCLGPCDVANVGVVITPAGTEWYGRLEGDAVYQAFVDWALACKAAGALVPRPACLAAHRFERFFPATERSAS